MFDATTSRRPSPRRGLALLALAAAVLGPAFADPTMAEPAPTGRGYVVMMTRPQIDSGLVRHLLPPLTDALDRAGMVNAKGPSAEWVVSVESASDDGSWLGTGESRRWRHRRTVSLTFARNEGFPRRPDTATFTVEAHDVTADPDRPDEYRCLVDLAVRTALSRWRASGRIEVRGVECERGE